MFICQMCSSAFLHGCRLLEPFMQPRPFPPNISPSFTLTFCLKQHHACYHSRHAKGSFTEINNGRDSALLSHRPSGSSLLLTQEASKGFPTQARGRKREGSAPTCSLPGETEQILMNPCLWLRFIYNTY